MSEQFVVNELEILNEENEWKGEYWWAVVNTQRVEDCFECRNKEVALKLCDFLNKATDDFKWQIKQSEKWSAKVKQLNKENEQLKKKIKPSIYNKKDGDWKWNVDNNTILNIRTGEIFYLRNSGAVENLVHLLNKLEQILSENEKMLQKDLDMLTELRRENEQLKKQLELRTESDKYHQRMLLKWLCIDEDEE